MALFHLSDKTIGIGGENILKVATTLSNSGDSTGESGRQVAQNSFSDHDLIFRWK